MRLFLLIFLKILVPSWSMIVVKESHIKVRLSFVGRKFLSCWWYLVIINLQFLNKLATLLRFLFNWRRSAHLEWAIINLQFTLLLFLNILELTKSFSFAVFRILIFRLVHSRWFFKAELRTSNYFIGALSFIWRW